MKDPGKTSRFPFPQQVVDELQADSAVGFPLQESHHYVIISSTAQVVPAQ